MKKENNLFDTDLAQIILLALEDGVIDNETILTLAFYLQIGLIKVISNIEPEFLNTLKPTFRTERSYNSKSDGKDDLFDGDIQELTTEDEDAWDDFLIERISINEKFEKNKNTLLEITKDILDNDKKADLPKWMKQWLKVCKTEFRAGKNKTTSFTYKKVINTVYQQLSLTSKTTGILTHFVQRVFGLMNAPNAIIMGAQKSGTSTLHYTLIAHSKINGPISPLYDKPIKEVNFIGNRTNWKKGVDYYFSHFSGSTDVFLDSSPNYLAQPFCYKRMRVIVPDAKLIICVRNPVHRAFSQYNHYKQILPTSKNWDWRQSKDFLTNLKMELHDIQLNLEADPFHLDSRIAFPGFLLRGIYIKQINELLNYYNRSQIYITVTDWWAHNYESELENIQTFLGLEKEILPPKIANKREYTVEPFDCEANRLLREFYKPYNKKLFDFLGFEIPEWDQ